MGAHYYFNLEKRSRESFTIYRSLIFLISIKFSDEKPDRVPVCNQVPSNTIIFVYIPTYFLVFSSWYGRKKNNMNYYPFFILF